MDNLGWRVLVLILFLIFLIFLGYFVTWFFNKKGVRFGGRGGEMRVLDRLPLANDKSIMLVRLFGKNYLLGVTKTQINLLGSVPEEDIIDLLKYSGLSPGDENMENNIDIIDTLDESDVRPVSKLSFWEDFKTRFWSKKYSKNQKWVDNIADQEKEYQMQDLQDLENIKDLNTEDQTMQDINAIDQKVQARSNQWQKAYVKAQEQTSLEKTADSAKTSDQAEQVDQN